MTEMEQVLLCKKKQKIQKHTGHGIHPVSKMSLKFITVLA